MCRVLPRAAAGSVMCVQAVYVSAMAVGTARTAVIFPLSGMPSPRGGNGGSAGPITAKILRGRFDTVSDQCPGLAEAGRGGIGLPSSRRITNSPLVGGAFMGEGTVLGR